MLAPAGLPEIHSFMRAAPVFLFAVPFVQQV